MSIIAFFLFLFITSSDASKSWSENHHSNFETRAVIAVKFVTISGSESGILTRLPPYADPVFGYGFILTGSAIHFAHERPLGTKWIPGQSGRIGESPGRRVTISIVFRNTCARHQV